MFSISYVNATFRHYSVEAGVNIPDHPLQGTLVTAVHLAISRVIAGSFLRDFPRKYRVRKDVLTLLSSYRLHS